MILTYQFARFAVVGAAGFLVDSVCLMLALALGAGFFAGRGLSYLTAATFTWILNRLWTFAPADDRYIRQWAKFVSANAFGGIINYCVYAALIIGLPAAFAACPVAAVAAGSLAGLVVNFTSSKRLVFGAGARAKPVIDSN